MNANSTFRGKQDISMEVLSKRGRDKDTNIDSNVLQKCFNTSSIAILLHPNDIINFFKWWYPMAKLSFYFFFYSCNVFPKVEKNTFSKVSKYKNSLPFKRRHHLKTVLSYIVVHSSWLLIKKIPILFQFIILLCTIWDPFLKKN